MAKNNRRVAIGDLVLYKGIVYTVVDRKYKRNTTSGLNVTEWDNRKGKTVVRKRGLVASDWLLQDGDSNFRWESTRFVLDNRIGSMFD